MKLADFLIRGRQFFGFLIPGIMWIAFFHYLLGKDPLEFVESGNTIIRVSLLASIGYIVGFIFQTLIFPQTADRIKAKIGIPETVAPLADQIKKIIKKKLPEIENEWLLPDEHLPDFCKNYILENSKELKRVVTEKEDDINFMVANIIPAPALTISWLVYYGYQWYVIAFVVICIAVFWALLLLRLHHYLKKEKEEWYEFFLLLQIKNPEPKNEAVNTSDN